MAHSDDDPSTAAPRSHRTRFELVFASLWLAVGLFAMPAIVYSVGSGLLGPYGENAGLGRFYGDFFRDLAQPSLGTWTLALGPLVLVTLVRLVFVGVRGKREAPPAQTPPAPKAEQKPRPNPRVEPRVTLD
jgi:hypothetical protein